MLEAYLMTFKELDFKEDFKALLDRYQSKLEPYVNNHRPESGFITNFQSLRVVGKDINLDLYELFTDDTY
jgi:hypothetical protein